MMLSPRVGEASVTVDHYLDYVFTERDLAARHRGPVLWPPGQALVHERVNTPA
jgi:hypothetical protein